MILVRLCIDLTTSTKILNSEPIGHPQSFRTFAIRYQKSQKFQNTHFTSIFKVISRKWHWILSYRKSAKSVSMLDQAKLRQKRIYASFLDQIDWTKTILVYNSQGEIESIVTIEFEVKMVTQALILCFEFW